MTKYFETPKELAERVGITAANVRFLIREGELEHIFMAPSRRNPKVPSGAWERYMAQSAGSPIEKAASSSSKQ